MTRIDDQFNILKCCILVLILFQLVQKINSATKRCYVCKSRGPLGDCKDPFYYNSTSIKLLSDVEERLCPSGWCAKFVQLKESEALLSTERFCLQRPPTDGEERCSETLWGENGRTHVFMCFCKGDFCNHSTKLVSFNLLLFSLIIFNLYLFSN